MSFLTPFLTPAATQISEEEPALLVLPGTTTSQPLPGFLQNPTMD